MDRSPLRVEVAELALLLSCCCLTSAEPDAYKAALASLTREMAADFGPDGIRVNAIAPGEIDTAILSPGTEKIVETIPLRRLGLTSEVADIIYFLCSDQASYVSGGEIHINGGQHV